VGLWVPSRKKEEKDPLPLNLSSQVKGEKKPDEDLIRPTRKKEKERDRPPFCDLLPTSINGKEKEGGGGEIPPLSPGLLRKKRKKGEKKKVTHTKTKAPSAITNPLIP